MIMHVQLSYLGQLDLVVIQQMAYLLNQVSSHQYRQHQKNSISPETLRNYHHLLADYLSFSSCLLGTRLTLSQDVKYIVSFLRTALLPNQ